jgi:hypothetical protein
LRELNIPTLNFAKNAKFRMGHPSGRNGKADSSGLRPFGMTRVRRWFGVNPGVPQVRAVLWR